MKRFLAVFKRQRTTLPPVVADAAFAPIAQAARCLDVWLSEEGRSMTPRHRQRAAALIARYFEHEDDASDQLILSFLRHYAGMGAVDLEDPQAVRLELKSVLDRSIALPPSAQASRARLLIAMVTGMLATATVLVVFYLSQQTLTLQEQQQLRAAVAARAVEQHIAPATIWADIKRDLGVVRYQDIRSWDFERALEKARKSSAF